MRQEENSLKEQIRNIHEEARMVPPGIQALFGFQTVAVFNQRFTDLPHEAMICHILALSLVVLSIALVMTPAAYHRIVETDRVSERTVRLSSLLICAALAPLACGLALDMFVVLSLATHSAATSIAGGLVTLMLLMGLWFAFPFRTRRRR